MAEQWAVEVDVKKHDTTAVVGGGGGQAYYFVRMQIIMLLVGENCQICNLFIISKIFHKIEKTV